MITQEDRLKQFLKKHATDDHSIYTPIELTDSILNRVKVKGDILVIANPEWLISLSKLNISNVNVWFVSPCVNKIALAKTIIKDVNVFHMDWDTFLNKGLDLKFDVALGNPPYQDGKNGKFYQEFVNKVSLLSDTVAMVTPTGWTTTKGVKTKFSQMIITNMTHYKYLDVYFDDAAITVCYFILDKKSYTPTIEAKVINDPDTLVLRKTDTNIVFPASSIATTKLLNRIVNSSEGCVPVCGRIGTTEANTAPFGDYKCIVTTGGKGEMVTSSMPTADRLAGLGKHKAVVNLAGNWDNLGGIKYAGPEYGVTVSSWAFLCDTEQEAINTVDYLNSQLVKFVVKIGKASKFKNTKALFSKIPKVDLTRSWTDAELYAHFDLTQEEIDYVESTVK